MILEIGCNDGSNIFWFFELFDNPTIHCFEPDPRAINRFENKIGDRKGVVLHKLAISDRNDIVDFYQSDGKPNNLLNFKGGWDLSGSILKPKLHLKVYPWCKFENKIKVRTTKLDDWIEKSEIELIDFIWMDVQGAEWHVLKGAENSLYKIRYIYTEYSNLELYKGQRSLLELNRLLKDFRILKRYSNDVLFVNKNL